MFKKLFTNSRGATCKVYDNENTDVTTSDTASQAVKAYFLFDWRGQIHVRADEITGGDNLIPESSEGLAGPFYGKKDAENGRKYVIELRRTRKQGTGTLHIEWTPNQE